MTTDDNKIVELQVVDPDDPAHTDTLEGAGHLRTKAEANHLQLQVNQHRLVSSGAWTTTPMTHHINTKRKSVEDKVRPTAVPSSNFVHQTLRTIQYDRDPYNTPLTANVPPFRPAEKLTMERINSLSFGPLEFINDEERNLLLHVITLCQKAIAFDKKDKRSLNPAYTDPFVINLSKHEPWTDPSPPYPRSDREAAIRLLKEQLRDGDLEPSTSPYVTSQFFVKKKNGDLRMIIDMRTANQYTVRDANIPPYLPDYVDGFVVRVCYGLGDLLSFFDQLPLDPGSRLLTAFRTPLGLLQKTGLPQGGTNSPAMAQCVSDHVGGEDVPDHIVPFIDDFGIKGPKTRYDDQTLPNSTIRRWVFEYAVTFERFLYRIEHAHLVVSGSKLVVITDELDITGIRVGFEGKSAGLDKIDRLQERPNPCPSQSSLRGFLGIANFLRPFIKNMAVIDEPLRKLVGRTFRWNPDASEAVNRVKEAAAAHHYLGIIDYGSESPIVVSVDSSQIAVGYTLLQEHPPPRGRVVILYDSIAMTETEARYSQPKLELCGVYKAIRKLRYHLICTRFILEVDAMSLRQMINKPDVGNATMIRWIANLKEYDFTIRHIPGKHHVIPDGLSRTNFNNAEEAEAWPEDGHVRSIEHTVLTQSIDTNNDVPDYKFAKDKYVQRFGGLALWLSTGGTHPNLSKLSRQERKRIRGQLSGFFMEQGRLYRRNPERSPQLVIDNPDDKVKVMAYAHEELGHRGRDAMTALLLERFWWESIRGDCAKHARSCATCQRRSRESEVEAQRSTPIPRLFEDFALDIVDTGTGTGLRRYLVIARDLLTGWVEARALPNKLASSVAKFIEDDILARYGPMVRQILTDNGPENSGETEALLRRLGLRHARITPNHPQGNAIVERGHAPIVEGLLKASYDDRERCHLYLPHILLADRITARR
ncbi:hypothetical protein A4X06_0g8679, partial [Tilletia controversa]